MQQQYKIFIQTRLGKREMNPLGTPNINWSRDVNDFRYGYKLSFPKKLTFYSGDFNWLYKLEHSTYRCEYLRFSIARLCGGTYLEDYVVGRISLDSGEWNLDECKVTLEVEPDNEYTCYDDHADSKANLLYAVTSRHTAYLVSGTLEYTSCTRTYGSGGTVIETPSPCPQPDGAGWTLYHYKIVTVYSGPSAG